MSGKILVNPKKLEVHISEVGSGWNVEVFDRRFTSPRTYDMGIYSKLHLANRAIEKEFEESYQKPSLNVIPTTRAGFKELDRWTGRRK